MTTHAEPVWTCEVCQGPLVPAKGNGAQWNPERDPDDGDIGCTNGRWRVLHYRCNGGGDYSIDVARITTWADVAHWSAHLHGKGWFAATNWDDVLSRAGVNAWQA